MNIDCQHPTEEFLRSIDVHELLPQQEPFVMVGQLVNFDMQHVVTETTVMPSNIFADDGVFSASGLIENIAQTCAVRIGYINKYILKRGIQLGFIGAIRNLEIFETPMVGQTLTTSVNVLEEVFGMILATARVTCGERLLVTAEMKIAVRNEDETND